MDFTNKQSILYLLKSNNLTNNKSLGQNFLINRQIVDKIISACSPSENDLIIEIGPGLGVLTNELVDSNAKVIAIEKDKNLIPILNNYFAKNNNFTLLNQDVLKIDFRELIKERGDRQNVKIISNLPYYITTPIITMLLESEIEYDNITIMLQKEVKERLMATPNTKAYAAITLFVNYYAIIDEVAFVGKESFYPSPKVDSSVIRLRPNNNKLKVDDKDLMFKLIRASFNQRRKKLTNAISNVLNIDKDTIVKELSKIGYDENVRGEVLSLEDFAALTNLLLKNE